MKHIITILVISAFTVVAAQAGEDCAKSCSAAKSACAGKAKVMKTVSTVKGAQLLVMAKK